MIHLAKREIIVCKRFAKNKAEIFLEGTVIDVDRTRCISETAVIFGSYQMEKKCTEV